MPANVVKINLLGNDDLNNSPIGRLITWAITYGRYIMIGTEIVVLLAFISRFSLDRKLTDLKEQIYQKQAILEANTSLEKDIRTLQSRIETVSKLTDNQTLPLDLLDIIQQATPPDVQFQLFSYNPEQVQIQATAGTTEGFSQFLVNINSLPHFSSVEMQSVKKEPLVGIVFQIAGHMKKQTKKE